MTITSNQGTLELTHRDYDNLNLIAHELLEKIKADPKLYIPITLPTAINYTSNNDLRALDYCLFQLCQFKECSAPETPIYPHHVAAAMHLLNAAYVAYQKARGKVLTPFIFDTSEPPHIRWTLQMHRSVSRDAHFWLLLDKNSTTPQIEFPSTSGEDGDYIPTFMRPYYG